MMKKLFVIIVGFVAVGIGIFSIITARGLSQRCTVGAVGTVVDMKIEETTEYNDDGSSTVYTYYPIIEYQVGDRTVTQQSTTGSGSAKYKVNEKIAIMYNPNKVEEFIIKGDKTANIVGIVFVAAGIAIAIVGMIKRF